MPLTSDAHLDDVGREIVSTLVQLDQLVCAADAPTVRWQPRTEHIGHEAELLHLADRTIDPRGVTERASRPDEFGMGIAHLMLGQPTSSELVDEMPSGEAMLDHAAAAHRVKAEARGHGATGYRLISHPCAARRMHCANEIHPSAGDCGDTWCVDTATITYGPDLPDESELRLCGDISGRRVLEIGSCPNAVALAQLGAKSILVEASRDRIAEVRRNAERNEVTVECHVGGPADLGFAMNASIDLVICVAGLPDTDDVSRVFRQAHRVLRQDCALVLAVPHPFTCLLGPDGSIQRRYAESGQQSSSVAGLFGALQRANFTIDVLLEPMARGPLPSGLIMRARKLGS